jgi:CheY-like chemotaxis protein
VPDDAQDRIAFLVENDADMRRALTTLLEKWGLTVLDAESGEEAVALIEEIGILPDVFLVDHQLGDGMTGVEFVTLMRARYGDVPARVLTANRSAEVRAACEAARVGMIYKPIDARDLGAFLAGL